LAILPYPFKSGSRTVVPGAADTEGDTDSLHAAFENYLTNTELLNQHSQNAGQMAEALFDRETTYAALANFIIP
jgi:glycosyltransferase involved in cell wall biosynthesis